MIQVQMISRSLTRRLKRLEEVITPEIVRRVWHIIIVDSEGSRLEGETIEWQAPRPDQRDASAFRRRYR
jgi:hypothetical protein